MANRNLIDFRVLKAGGNEPGWSLDAQKKGGTINYDMVLDYGDITLSGDEAEFQAETGILIVNSDKGMIAVQLVRDSCMDAAGRSYELSVSFSYNDREYIGCGNLEQ